MDIGLHGSYEAKDRDSYGEERERLEQRYEIFSKFPPERQELARGLYRRFMNLPEDRRRSVRTEFQRLSAMPLPARRARILSDDFRSMYTPQEQRLLRELAILAPPQ